MNNLMTMSKEDALKLRNEDKGKIKYLESILKISPRINVEGYLIPNNFHSKSPIEKILMWGYLCERQMLRVRLCLIYLIINKVGFYFSGKSHEYFAEESNSYCERAFEVAQSTGKELPSKICFRLDFTKSYADLAKQYSDECSKYMEEHNIKRK